MAAGSWSLAEELFARGDPGFVDELRRVRPDAGAKLRPELDRLVRE